MALFKKEGANLSRAAGIIASIKPNADTPPGDKPADTPPGDKPADTPPGDKPADTPPGDKDKKLDVPSHTDPPKITEEAVFNYLSETLKREVKSIDDLTIKEERELDPEVKQILDWKEKTGLSLSKWSDYTKDFSKMGDLDVAREILAQKYPTFDKEELAHSLKEFVFEEDYDDDAEKMTKSIALKKYAQDGRQQLEANQLKLVSTEGNALTEQQQKDLDLVAKFKEGQTNAQANQAKYLEDLNTAATSLTALNLKLSDDLTINYDISEGDRRTLPKTITEMPHWYNEDGSVNHSNVVSDGLKVRDFDKIVQKAYEQGLAVGTEAKIKGDRNITIDGKTPLPHSVEGEKKGNVADVIDNIAGKRKSKLRFGRTEK